MTLDTILSLWKPFALRDLHNYAGTPSEHALISTAQITITMSDFIVYSEYTFLIVIDSKIDMDRIS